MTGNFSLVQVLTPDHLRGRVMSVRLIVFGLQPFALLITGVIAETYGAPLAVTLTGLSAVVCGIVILVVFPALRTRRMRRSRRPAAMANLRATPLPPMRVVRARRRPQQAADLQGHPQPDSSYPAQAAINCGDPASAFVGRTGALRARTAGK